MRPTAARGLLMLTAYSIVVACAALGAYAVTKQYAVVRDLSGPLEGARLREVQRIEDQYAWVDIVLLVGWALGASTTAVWSVRVATNVERLGQQVSPGEACWSWFVPVWNLFGGFRQLRKAPGVAWSVSVWQLAYLAPIMTTIASRFAIVARGVSDVGSGGRISDGTWDQLFRDVLIVSIATAAFYLLAFAMAARTVAVLRRNFAEIDAARIELQAAAAN